MRWKKFLGIFLIALSFIITLSNLTILGAVIGSTASSSLSFLSILFLAIGIALVLVEKEGGLEKTLAQQILGSGAIITNPKKLRKIARKSGYKDGKEVREGYQVFDYEGNPLTVIPNHNISKGVYRSIIKALATGESSFRREESYSHP